MYLFSLFSCLLTAVFTECWQNSDVFSLFILTILLVLFSSFNVFVLIVHVFSYICLRSLFPLLTAAFSYERVVPIALWFALIASRGCSHFFHCLFTLFHFVPISSSFAPLDSCFIPIVLLSVDYFSACSNSFAFCPLCSNDFAGSFSSLILCFHCF